MHYEVSWGDMNKYLLIQDRLPITSQATFPPRSILMNGFSKLTCGSISERLLAVLWVIFKGWVIKKSIMVCQPCRSCIIESYPQLIFNPKCGLVYQIFRSCVILWLDGHGGYNPRRESYSLLSNLLQQGSFYSCTTFIADIDIITVICFLNYLCYMRVTEW